MGEPAGVPDQFDRGPSRGTAYGDYDRGPAAVPDQFDRGPSRGTAYGDYDRGPAAVPDQFDRGPGRGTAYGDYDREPAAVPDQFDRGPGRGPAYGDYDQEPISRGGYAPSDAVSVAESRVGAFGSKTFVFEGKEYNVWTEGQLSAMGRDALKNRCLDFRDHIGRDRLPPMPRHPEAMVQWLLCVQKVVMQGGDSDEHPTGGMMRGGPPGGGPPGGMARGGPAIDYQRGYEPSEVGSQAPSEAQSNYEKNMQDAQAIRRRNQGSGGLW